TGSAQAAAITGPSQASSDSSRAIASRVSNSGTTIAASVAKARGITGSRVAAMVVAVVLRKLRALLLLAVVSGCGVGKGTPEWIGSNAAVVRCTVAGPNLELPRLFDELPSPALPTGLYARTMDPIALDQLG